MIQVGFKSSKGKREKNEDACYVMPEQNVYIVADGVGGSNAGELASRSAVTGVAELLREEPLSAITGENELKESLEKVVEEVNDRVFDLSKRHPDNFGMATTLIICYIRGNAAYFVNVGDSRAYLWHGGKLYQLTEDHTYVNTLIRMGVLSKTEAAGHQKSNMITKAIGVDGRVGPDFYRVDITDGDVILLCSDGLYGEL